MIDMTIVICWFNPLVLLLKSEPPFFVIDALNRLRKIQADKDTFYLRKIGFLLVRDPYAFPMATMFHFRRWHLFSWKLSDS